MKSIASAISVLALAALVGGCAHFARDPLEAGPKPVRVDVTNRNFNDANLWAVYRAERVRLGTVTGKSDGSFRLPWKGTEPVHMEFDLVGGGRCTTEDLVVDEGDVLYLEIDVEIASMQACSRG